MVFSKNWLRNHPQFLLYFLIHIDVLMLCRKFELIPTTNFWVMAIFKNGPISEKYPVLYSPCFFLKNCSKITPNFYYIFWYILMSLCYVESLSWFRRIFFKFWAFLKNEPIFEKKNNGYSPWFFQKLYMCRFRSDIIHVFICRWSIQCFSQTNRKRSFTQETIVTVDWCQK